MAEPWLPEMVTKPMLPKRIWIRSFVTLDTNMPSSVSANAAALENVTYTPSVEIENNVFREMPVRGILVTTRKPVVIRNNEFDNVAGAAVYISDDVNSWYESGHDEDVLIEGNVFRRCGVNQSSYSAFIQFDPTNNGAKRNRYIKCKDQRQYILFYKRNQQYY